MGDDQTFNEAYARVRSQHDPESWLHLSSHKIAEAIYQQMRAIDAERRGPVSERPEPRVAERRVHLAPRAKT
jgi:hypothetical protein